MLGKKMRIGAVATLGAGLLLASSFVRADAVVPGLVDVSVDIASKPATVSPAGSLVLLEITVSNVGVVPAATSVAVDLPAGSVYRDDLSDGACEADGSGATCTTPELASQTSRVLEVVAHTPVTPGLVTTTATVSASGVFEDLEHQGNNSATADTDVLATNGTIAAGFVEEGDSLSLDVGDGRKYVLTVPQGVPGVIVKRLADQSGFGKQCGVHACGDGFVIDFVPHPVYKAENPMNPLQGLQTFGRVDGCQGLGGTCSEIWWAKSPDATVLAMMSYCPGAGGPQTGNGTAVPSPCINDKYKVNGTVWYDVRLLSNDPISVPPIRVS